MNKLFCFGLGFSAQALASHLTKSSWSIAGTSRTAGKCAHLRSLGIDAFIFDGTGSSEEVKAALADTTHVLLSIPPTADGDPVLQHYSEEFNAFQRDAGKAFDWMGYLSTTGVYGNSDGAEVTETTPVNPSSPRSEYRVAAEQEWLDSRHNNGLPVHIFRLAGIYGPGRSIIDQVKAGAARRIDKPDHLFSRIHVDDIANVLLASIKKPNPGSVYNVCDDEPAAQSNVVAHACQLMGVEPPPLIPFEDAAPNMSPMALSFWRDNRRVVNARIKEDLGVTLEYPTYREGFASILTRARQAKP